MREKNKNDGISMTITHGIQHFVFRIILTSPSSCLIHVRLRNLSDRSTTEANHNAWTHEKEHHSCENVKMHTDVSYGAAMSISEE